MLIGFSTCEYILGDMYKQICNPCKACKIRRYRLLTSCLCKYSSHSALWMVYMTQEPESVPAYRSFPITLFSQFELSVGLIDLPVDHTIATPPIVHVLHCAFSVVSYILLLNLLIAMMSDTHWRVAQERDELWRTQVTHTDMDIRNTHKCTGTPSWLQL